MTHNFLKHHQAGCLTDKDSHESVEELEDDRSLTESSPASDMAFQFECRFPNCDFIFSAARDIPAHEEECDHRPESCRWCGQEMSHNLLKDHQDGCLTEKDSHESVEELEDERSLTESDRDWSNENLVAWSDEEEGDATKHHFSEKGSTASDELVLEIEDEVSN